MKPAAWLARLGLFVLLTTTLNCGDGGKSHDAATGMDGASSGTLPDAAETQADLATIAPDAPAREDGTGIDEDAIDGTGLADSRVGFEDGASQSCWYERAHTGTALSNFSFSFVAPDQVTYSCGSGPARDAGPPWPRDLRGVATSVTDNQFTIDTCSAQDACVPSLYTFTLYAPGIRLTIPVGRQVRVQWQLAMFWGCTEWLAVSDDEPGLAGMVWLIGNGGFQTPGSELPFDVGLTQLDCRLPADAYGSSCSGAATGDYAFRFSSKYGPASSLSLGTQESGTFAFLDSAGVEQRMDIHCLRAFQTTMCDDYWNWDFWAVNTSAPSDGSALDAAIDR
jgi:hypothetical protein